jgi:hypothetical protein
MTMRAFVLCLASWVAGCGSGALKPMAAACTRATGADPGACLAVAKARLEREDEAGAKEYVEKAVDALNAAPACLRDHSAAGCFEGVNVLLREAPVGLLAAYDVSEGIRELAPRWAGSEQAGPRVQARIALHGMCTVPSGDPIERQRACLALGDLVEEERMKRCGPGCDPADASTKALLAGWSTTDVIDGYAAACKIPASGDAQKNAAFAGDIERIYKVKGICAVALSPARGASIPDALANMQRIRDDARVRAVNAEVAAKREAERLLAMKKQEAERLIQAAKAAEAAAKQQLTAAIAGGQWQVVFQLLKQRTTMEPLDASTASALMAAWDPLVAWGTSHSTVIAAYLDVAGPLSKLPPGHALAHELADLQARALAAAKALTKNTRGAGGAWLHAALVARVAGPSSPEARTAADAFAKFSAATRITLPADKLAPACAPLVKNVPGRKIRVTSTLECTIVPEKRFTTKEPFRVKQRVVRSHKEMRDGREETVIDGEEDVEQETTVEVDHRAFAIRAKGTITIKGVEIPIEIEEVVDDTDGTNPRTFEQAKVAATDAIWKATIGPLETAEAEKALEAGRKAFEAKRVPAAANHLAIHALLAGASSTELDEIVAAWGVTFAELLPPRAP